jgi:NADPH:quinone reductase
MKALIATGDSRLVEFAEVAPPEPADVDDGVIVQVASVSVNRGELHRLDSAAPGWRPGWDLAGVVAASTASSLPIGTEVFGVAFAGSWAERVAVSANQLAIKPPDLSWDQAAAMPIAGLTALRVLALADNIAGRRLLVTGAAGGVGRYAVQLASSQGAIVTAVVGNIHRGDGLIELGANEIISTIDQLGSDSFNLVLESAGGESLSHALRVVAADGMVVSIGNSSRSDARIALNEFYPKQAALRGFYVLTDLERRPASEDLPTLARFAANGRLDPHVASVDHWSSAERLLHELRQRHVSGKAVLRVASITHDANGRAVMDVGC